MAVIDRISGVTEGVATKAPCRVATTGNITLSGLQVVDGVQTVDADRVLVRDQDNSVENGVYVASSGNWTRAQDFDGARDVVGGSRIFVASGELYAGTEFIVVGYGVVLPGTSEIEFISGLKADSDFLRIGGEFGVYIRGIDGPATQNGAFGLGVDSAGSYAWMQTYNGFAIRLNPLGNNVIIGGFGPDGIAFKNSDSAPTQLGTLVFGIADTLGYAYAQTYDGKALSLNPIGNNVLIGTGTNSTFALDVLSRTGNTAAIIARSSALRSGFWAAQTATGTQEQFSFNKINITADDVSAAALSTVNMVNGFHVGHVFGGSAAKGGRNGVFADILLTAATAASNPYPFYTAVHGWASANAPDGGTLGSERGSLYGIGGLAKVLSGATNFANVVGGEFTVGIASGASAANRVALIVNGSGGATGKGSAVDALVVFNNQPSAGKFDTLMLVSNNTDGPLETTGTLFKASAAASIATGFDLSNFTISGNAWASPGATITGGGKILVGTAALMDSNSSMAVSRDGPVNFELRAHANSAAAWIAQYRSRGSEASPTSVADGDAILNFEGRAHDGSSYIASAAIRGFVEGAPSTGHVASNMRFYTSDASSNRVERMRIHASGGVSIGDTTDPGTDNLELDGVLKIDNVQVVGARDTGWTAMTGTSDKATAYATGSVTLPQLAGRLMALQAALTTHGLIGT